MFPTRRIVDEYPDVKVVYPVHLNPVVASTAKEIFEDCDRVKLIQPLDVIDFHMVQHIVYKILYN